MAKKLEEGTQARIIKHNLSLSSMGEVDMDNPEKVEQRVMEYFYTCAENDMQATFEGLSLSFGMNSKAFQDKVINDSTMEVQKIIAKAWQVCNCILVDLGTTGGVHPAITCFLAKNNYGYTDETKVVHKISTPLGEGQEQSKLQARYDALPIIADASEPKEVYSEKRNKW